MKPLLYIDPDGTLLIDDGHAHHNPFFNATPSKHAAAFMSWATKHFHVRWLTELPPSQAFQLAEHLGLKGHEVPYTSITESKSSAIDPKSNFYWVDTWLSPMDSSWVAQHNHADRIIAVSHPHGISEAHQKLLAEKINKRR